MNHRIVIGSVLLALWAAAVSAQTVPGLVNYQGRLNDDMGMPITGSVPMTFALWDGETAGTMLWSESQAVEVSGGLYSVILGNSVPVPASALAGATVFLEVTVTGETLAPRERLTAVPWAIRAEDAENLGGLAATNYSLVGHTHNFSEITGVATDAQIPDNITIDLAQNATQLGGQPANAYVLVAGDTVTGDLQINGTLHGAPNLTVSNNLYLKGGSLGLGTAPVPTMGIINSNIAAPTYGAYLFGTNIAVSAFSANDSSIIGELATTDTGVYGASGDNAATGPRAGGNFFAASSVVAYGVLAQASGNSVGPTYAMYSLASNSSSGPVFGGYFSTSTSGTGDRYGAYAASQSATNAIAYGIKGSAYGTGTGPVYGGNFTGTGNTSGARYGVYAESTEFPGYFAWSSDPSHNYAYLASQYSGIVARSGSASDPDAVAGGNFTAEGINSTYGTDSTAYAHGASSGFGVYGEGYNDGTGNPYGGYFIADLAGTGTHYGSYSISFASTSVPSYGTYAIASNTATGTTYGGYFTTGLSGTGTHYGAYGASNGYGLYGTWSTAPTAHYGYLGSQNYGVYGYSGTSSDTGTRMGGSFTALSQDPSAPVYGSASSGYGYGAAPAIGAYGLASNSSTGNAYGVYGIVNSSGTGSHYAVYAYAFGAGYGIYDAAGTKNWVNPDPEDPTKAVAYVTMEAGENLTYCRGTATLVDGHAVVVLPDHFRKVTSPDHPVTVQLTPRFNDTFGLSIISSGNAQIEVAELKGGTGNFDFDYTVQGVRLGYEDYQPIIDNVDYVPFQGNLSNLDDSEMTTQEFYDRQAPGLTRIFKQNGTLDTDGKVNQAMFKEKGWKMNKERKPGPARQ